MEYLNGLSISDWHDVLDPERLRMEIVEDFEECISDNVMQRKRYRENFSSRQKRLKRVGRRNFHELDRLGADISMTAAACKSKRSNRLNICDS
jgi:hypothetical protein